MHEKQVFNKEKKKSKRRLFQAQKYTTILQNAKINQDQERKKIKNEIKLLGRKSSMSSQKLWRINLLWKNQFVMDKILTNQAVRVNQIKDSIYQYVMKEILMSQTIRGNQVKISAN